MQIAERVFRDKGLAVDAHAADGFGDPGGVAAEKLVVFRRAQMAHQAQFDDKLIDQFLCFGLGENAGLQITLQINIQKRGGAAEGRGSAVVFLNAGQIAEIHGLHGLTGVCCGQGKIHPVGKSHLF